MVMVEFSGPPLVSSWISAKHWEGVDRRDDQDVQCGGHDLRPLDLPEGLQLRGTIHLGGLDQGLVHVAERGDIQHDGLANGGREQDQMMQASA